MPTIWAKDEVGWAPIRPAGFPDEAALHDLVEATPQLLPLSGQPQVVVLGREVQLGSGRADLVGIEPSGRLVIVEVKLRNNPESRRSIVSQVLSYAAFLHRETVQSLNSSILRDHLATRGYRNLADAMSQNYQEGDFDETSFLHDAEANLAGGAFRLVLVLDEAPPELVQMAGYLEAIASELLIDLITVDAYELDGRSLMAPQRVDPERVERIPVARAQAASAGRGFLTDGSEDFLKAIDHAPIEHQPLLRILCQWAEKLAGNGFVQLTTYHGTRQGQLSLLPRLRDTGTGLVTIYSDNGVGSLALWRSLFETRAPEALARVEQLIADRVGQGSRTPPTPELLAELAKAYEEAAASSGTGRTLDKDLARRIVAAVPEGRWLSYADIAEVAAGSRTGGMAVGAFLASDPSVPERSVHRVLNVEGKVSPGFHGSIGGPNEVRAQLEREGISFDLQGRASSSSRIPVRELKLSTR